MPGLDKKYDPNAHEPRIIERWERSDAFRADPARADRNATPNHTPPGTSPGTPRPPYCILIPPPNVTDRLHLGHALNNSLQDILIRAHRMMGYEALWLPGTDHAGIATQTRVDKQLKAEGKPGLAHYKQLELSGKNGREQFVALVQAWKDEYEATIISQLKRMGCSCDWSRQRFTMDDICARAVREAFFRLFKDGLIERGKRLVNWDPATQTALSDDEVEMREVDGIFAYLRYPLVHPGTDTPVTWSELFARGYPKQFAPKGETGDDDPAFITVATTRPETYLGDTAVAMHPDDPRAGSLKPFHAELPLVGRRIPVIVDDYVVFPDFITGRDSGDAKAQMSTGFLKVTPAHDPNDYEIGRRHEETIRKQCSAGTHLINVMAPDASISDKYGWSDLGDAHLFVGLSREEARKKVLAEFKARNLLEAVKQHRHSVGHSYRSHVPIEPYLSDQWYVRVTDDRLVGFAQRALSAEQRSTRNHTPQKGTPSDGAMRFHPDRYARTYETWHDNLRDWCISRQLWWGHRIPVWFMTGMHPSDEQYESLNSKLKKWETQGRIHVQERGPAGRITNSIFEGIDGVGDLFICIRDAADNEITEWLEMNQLFTQDPDVLDTWFSSALWPLSTMGWPDPEQSQHTQNLLDRFNPTSVLCTAREIITLWVSRMAMFNRYFLSPDNGKTPGHIPYRDVFIHAMIQDGEGRKMSKSLGNGVDPLDIIHSHGTDAMRFTLCQMTTQTQDVRMPVEPDPATGRNTSPKFDIGRNFATKLWNAARFTLMNLEESSATSSTDPINAHTRPLADRWMLSRLAHTIRKANEALAEYQFSAYASAMYDIVWRDFCDWYLEATKPTVQSDAQQQGVLRATLDALLRLLHPICPFITETIHEALGAHTRAPVKGLTLPASELDNLLCRAGWPQAHEALIDDEAERTFERIQTLVEAIRQTRAQQQIPSRERPTLHADPDTIALVNAASGIVESLAQLGSVSADAAPDNAIEVRFEGRSLALSGITQQVDTGAQRSQLEDAIGKLDKDIAALDKRLSNPGYTQKAPANLVQETRDQLDAKVRERDELKSRLASL